MSNQSEEKVRILSSLKPGKNSTRMGEVTIGGLTPEEVEIIEGMVNGASYVYRNGDGRLHFTPVHQPLPGPTEDKAMLPFWRRASKEEMSVVQEELFERYNAEHHFPSIIIQSLCGYNYSEENYRHQVQKLESFGFECLRSRRGDEGRYWEVWILYDLVFAKGELAEAIGDIDKKKAFKKALDFLQSQCQFGTLDVTVQRMAMEIEPDM